MGERALPPARRLPGGPGRCVAGAENQKLTESAEGNLLPLEQQPLKRLLPWLQVAGENGKLKHFDQVLLMRVTG